MGVLIVDEEYNTLYDGSRGRAQTFIDMMEFVSKKYGLPVPAAPFWSDEFHLESKAFCVLVEKTFENPIEFFYPWARYAAGMYDIIKGEKHQWMWPLDSTPFVPVRKEGWEHHEIFIRKGEYPALVPFPPMYHCVDIPEKQSDKSFGAKPSS